MQPVLHTAALHSGINAAASAPCVRCVAAAANKLRLRVHDTNTCKPRHVLPPATAALS